MIEPFSSAGPNHNGGPATSVTQSIACPTATATGFLIVRIAMTTGVTISGVTYNGVTVPQLTTNTIGTMRGRIYGLANPQGGTHDLVVSHNELTGGNRLLVYSSVYENVDTAASPRSSFSATGTSSAPSTSRTTAVGDLVIDALSADFTGTATVGADQSSEYNALVLNSTPRARGSRELATGSTTTMSWTLESSADWIHNLTVLIPVPVDEESSMLSGPRVMVAVP